MLVQKIKEFNLHKWTSKTGKVFYKKMPVIMCYLICDNCRLQFQRQASELRLRDSNHHFCGHCGNALSLGSKIGRASRLVNLQERIGETWIDSCGYRRVYVGPHYKGTGVHCGTVREHILVMEKFLNRSLNKGEVIHHIDGDKTNNNVENLQVMSVEDHNRCHGYNDTLVLWMFNLGLMDYNNDTKTYVLKEEYCKGQSHPPTSKKRKKNKRS